MSETKLTLAEVLARVRPITFPMIKHVIDNSFDPHRQALDFREVMLDEIEFAFTGFCKHNSNHVVQVTAKGDLSWGLTGAHCRACNQRVRPRVIQWETDTETLPAPPRTA
jgi:hypothetical protein